MGKKSRIIFTGLAAAAAGVLYTAKKQKAKKEAGEEISGIDFDEKLNDLKKKAVSVKDSAVDAISGKTGTSEPEAESLHENPAEDLNEEPDQDKNEKAADETSQSVHVDVTSDEEAEDQDSDDEDDQDDED